MCPTRLPTRVGEQRNGARSDRRSRRRTSKLLAYLHEYRNVFAPVFANHMVTTFTASIVGGLLNDAAVAAGDPTLVTDLMGAYGEVASAHYANQMWQVARIVRANPTVSAAFDEGVGGVLERLTRRAGWNRVPSCVRSVPRRLRPPRSQRLGAVQPHVGEHP